MTARRMFGAICSILILLVVSLALGLNMLAAQSTPVVWTGKLDYGPSELVDIHGHQFLPDSWYRVLVVWPDGSARVAGNNGITICTDVTAADGSSCFLEVLADADGTFLLQYQLLNGMKGEYRYFVYDQAGVVVAQGTFTDDPSGPGNSHSHLVRNANELPGQSNVFDPTAFESQRKIFRSPRGVRHLYALLVISNPSNAAVPGGLWLFRSTDGGSTWSAHTRLAQDTANPPKVSGSMWFYDDGTQVVIYVAYAKDGGGGSSTPISIFYRRILIADSGTLTVGAEQATGGETDTGGSKPDAARPAVVRDRNGNVQVGFWWSKTTLRIFGTLESNPGDAPTWSDTTDVLTYPNNGTQNLPLLLPFTSGALVGYVGIGREGTGSSAENKLYARDVTGFDTSGGAYTFGTQRILGGITRGSGPDYLPFSGAVDSANVAHILYIKDCPGSGGGACASTSAGASTGVYSRKAGGAGSVDAWDTAVQVLSTVPNTVSLTIDTLPNPDRLYAFFGTSTGGVSFKTSAANAVAWGTAGCAETGGTVSGGQCNLLTESNGVDWFASSYNAPVQLLYTVNTSLRPVKHYYVNTAPDVAVTFTPDGSNGWFKTSPTPPARGNVTAVDDDAIVSISCTGPVSLSLGVLVGGGTSQASRTVSVLDETGGANITCTATDDNGISASGAETAKVDATAPSVSSLRSPEANADGWNKTDVTVSFTCADALSGLAAASLPALQAQPFAAEGAGQSARRSCSDNAGNANSSTVTGINIDKTAPAYGTPSRAPAANADNWNNTDVTVSFPCLDTLSGPTPSAVEVTLTTEGSAQTAGVNASACADKAGNTAAAGTSLGGINIDKTAPAITGNRSPAANANGWNNTDVTVHFICSDGLSGLAAGSPPADALFGGEGAGQSVSESCADLAGNSASTTVGDINIDKTKPLASAAASPGANVQGWNNTDVTVGFNGSDALSGIDVCDAPATLSVEGTGLSATGSCTDKAGNPSDPATAGGINIDKTKPLIAGSAGPAANAAGWNNSDVTVAFTCADVGSVQSGVLTNTLSAVVLSAEGANQSAPSSGGCADKADNSADAVTVDGINIDKTAPAITGTRSPAGNLYGWNNSDVTVHFDCTDTLSGLAAGSPPDDTVLNAESASLSATGTCADVADNGASATVGGIKIDKTPPSITGSRSPLANANGWNNTDITVHFQCLDSLSGLDASSPPDDAVLSGEGTGQFVQGVCTDQAGNGASATVGGINIDKTPPVVSVTRSPLPNVGGWNNSDVTAHWTGTDALSGLGPLTEYDFVFSAEGADQTGSFGFTDLAGNMASAAIEHVNIDRTAPLILGSRTPAANPYGWNNTDVTVHFDCTDGLSGLVAGDPPVDTVLTVEGAGQSVDGDCADLAGNSAGATVGAVAIDKTAPIVSATRTPDPNANGWNNTSVVAHWSASDALSGLVDDVSAYRYDFTSEGAGQTASFAFSDLAGNMTGATISNVNIDITPPSIAGSLSAAPNAHGWNHTDVTAHFECADTLAGLAEGSPPADTTFSEEGAGQSVTKTCSDQADNTASATVGDINIDKTKPVITGVASPAANGAGWNNTDVTVDFSCHDAGAVQSGIQTDSLVDAILAAEGAGQSAASSGLCIDKADNSANAVAVGGISIDKTAPTLTFDPATPAANAAGWNRTDVSVPFTASDGLSGVAATTPGASPLVLTTEGSAVSGQVLVTDNAGNGATFTSPLFKIDKTPPVIGILGPANGEIDILNSVHPAAYSCADVLSSITGCSGPVPSGSNFDTASVGAKSFTVNASDVAGNTSSLTSAYHIQYLAAGTCSGAPGHAILQPINADGTSVFKQKSTVPSKFRVCDALGASIGSPGVVSSFRLVESISGVVTTTLDDEPVSTTPDTTFRWDAVDRQWVFNLNTKNLSANRTYVYSVVLNDGTTIQYRFGLK